MEDFKEGAFLYIIGAVIILFVLVQSVYFLVRAVRRGKELGISAKAMKEVAFSSGTFSIIPSVPIVLAMVTLAATIGTPLSWIRLSVIGSMTYETTAAKAVVDAAKSTLADPGTFVLTQSIFASVMWIMTIGIMAGPVFNLFGLKRYQKKLQLIGQKDSKWSNVFSDALFMGIIAVFGGQFIAKGIAAFGNLAKASVTLNGEAQLLTLLTSVVLMLIFGAVIKLTKAKWLENFALPVSMVGAILLSIVYHNLFAGVA